MGVKVFENLIPLFTSYNNLFTCDLANLQRDSITYNTRSNYYQLTTEQAPYDEEILLVYAKFLLYVKKDFELAKIKLLRIYKSQKNHRHTNFMLAKIAIAEKKYEQARSYLNKNVKEFHTRFTYLILTHELYFRDFIYLDKLVQLTEEQKEIFLQDISRGTINSLLAKLDLLYINENENRKKIIALQKQIIKIQNRQESDCLGILTEKQVTLYLKDRNNLLNYMSAYKLRRLNEKTALSDTQNLRVLSLIKNNEVELHYIRLRLATIKVSEDNIQRADFVKRREIIGKKMDANLQEILTPNQYELYQKDKKYIPLLL